MGLDHNIPTGSPISIFVAAVEEANGHDRQQEIKNIYKGRKAIAKFWRGSVFIIPLSILAINKIKSFREPFINGVVSGFLVQQPKGFQGSETVIIDICIVYK